MLKWLLTLSAFEGDPRGFALNQIGHVALGAALAWALGPMAAVMLYAAWEGLHLSLGGTVWDGFEDMAFVTAGVLALTTPATALIIAALFLAAGVARRAGL